MTPRNKEELLTAQLIQECQKQSENPPCVDGEPDKYISMFAVALKDCLTDLPKTFQQQLEYVVNVKKSKGPFPPSFMFNHLLRSCQMDLMRDADDSEKYDSNYPYQTQEEWNERVSKLVTNKNDFRHLTYSMMMWNVGSDVETRVAGPKLVAHLLQKEKVDNTDEGYKILNIGSARDHTLAMLSGNVALPEIDVNCENLGAKSKFIKDRINELLSKTIHLGDSYGVDLWPLRDWEWSRFLESCRFYPSELSDPVRRQMYKQLEEIRDGDAKLHHSSVDYGLDSVEFGGKFNLVAYLTSLYQSHKDKQRDMFDEGLGDVEEDGLILVQDFCRIGSVNTKKHPIDQLEFIGPTSEPYAYGTFIYDPQKPKLGFRTFGLWNNGRCEKLKPAKLLLNSLV